MLDVARDPDSSGRERPPRLAPRRVPVGGTKGVDHARTAGSLDTWIRRLAGQEARIRLSLGRLASAFLSRQRHHELGFSRVSDWSHERLGISAPELRSLAKVADGLDRFPATRDAYLRDELSWTKVRLILSVLTAETEREWIARAALLTTRELEEEIRNKTTEPAGDEPADRMATKAAATALEELSAEDGRTIDGEPAVRFRKRCSRRLRRVWNRVTELARRMAGEQLCPWRAAECIAAEGLSGAPVDRIEDAAEVVGDATGDQASDHAVRTIVGVRGSTAIALRRSDPDPAPVGDDVPGNLPGLRDALHDDAVRIVGNPEDHGHHDLDLQMRALVSALQRIDWTAGRLLRIAGDLRVYRQLGFSSLAEYARDRLGISPRKVYALVSLDRKTASLGEVSTAYRKGKLSWSRVLAILPAVDRKGRNARAWVDRARAVTIRRLRDEVEWAIDRADLAGDGSFPVPPPLHARLDSQELHIRAPGEADEPEGHDAEIELTGPESVVSLFQTAIRAWTDPGETTERGLEKLLLHAYTEWTSQPRHRDPVFERDGWRCSVPVCTSRKNLHDHHVEWRSRGGGNELWNRSSDCVFHHLHGIHDLRIRVSGRAPDELTWEIGCRPGGPPLMVLQGDVYATDEGSALAAAQGIS